MALTHPGWHAPAVTTSATAATTIFIVRPIVTSASFSVALGPLVERNEPTNYR
jgi:hypothetical protein